MRFYLRALFVTTPQLLLRLLADRRKSMEFTISEGPALVEAHPGDEWVEAKVKLSTLKQKWEALILGTEQRSALCLATIEKAQLDDSNLEQRVVSFTCTITVHDKKKYSLSVAVVM